MVLRLYKFVSYTNYDFNYEKLWEKLWKLNFSFILFQPMRIGTFDELFDSELTFPHPSQFFIQMCQQTDLYVNDWTEAAHKQWNNIIKTIDDDFRS